jgi:hypothetical protein
MDTRVEYREAVSAFYLKRRLYVIIFMLLSSSTRSSPKVRQSLYRQATEGVGWS